MASSSGFLSLGVLWFEWTLWFSAQCGVSELSLPYFQFWPAEAEGQSHHVPIQPSFLRAW